MNHILSLQAKNAALQAKLVEVETLARDMRSHLAGDKFQGVDLDGSRKDWIATGDVNNFIDRVLGAV